ncbi:MAG TPA: protein phosphatase CheZ [Methylophilaceae bacterium]
MKAVATPIVDPTVKRIGEATARLHELLKNLGHSRNLEKTAATMTDARDRLSFVDKAMHEASEKTINSVEDSLPLINRNRVVIADLSKRLAEASAKEYAVLIAETVAMLGEVSANEEKVRGSLMQIMEAQEYRDLAGQMVNKIVGAAVEIENILLDILKEYAPTSKDSLISKEGLTAGPNMGKEADIAGQDDVDDILSSLGL